MVVVKQALQGREVSSHGTQGLHHVVAVKGYDIIILGGYYDDEHDCTDTVEK